jgi:uncharacterized protein YpbB
MVRQGMDAEQIAAIRGLAVSTIEGHIVVGFEQYVVVRTIRY